MKVLQVHNDYRVGGGENVVVDRDRADLEAAGHDVVQYRVANDASTVETVGLLLRAVWNRSEARRIEAVVEAEKPDVVHVHNTWFRLSPATISAVSNAGIPVVHTLHNYRWVCASADMRRNDAICRDCVEGSRLSAVRHRCYRSSLPLSIIAAATTEVADRRGVWRNDIDRLIALTPTARTLFAQWGFPAGRIVVRPHRIADPGVRGAPPSASDHVVCVGRISEEKGVDRLCEAWSSRRRSRRLKVIGEGPLADQLAVRFPEIEFIGKRDHADVLIAMKDARALILPTRWEEAFPLVVVEAMACGLPVALSDVAHVRDYVGAAAPEWIFDTNVTLEWERIFDLIANDAAVDAAGGALRTMYSDRFAPDGGDSLIQIYRDAIDQRKRP